MKNLTFTKVNKSVRYFMVELLGERMGNYDIANEIREKWENTNSEDSSFNGNVNVHCNFNLDKGEIEWSSEFVPDSVKFYNLLSSPLLLYRLICLFRGNPIIVNDPYKTIWWYQIKHKETGGMIMFGEWKGTANFWLSELHPKYLNEEFKKDIEDLLLFLVSDQIPHPYDRCTAGQIA